MIEGLNLIDAPQWVVLDRFTNARACDSTSEATLYTRLAEKVMRELGYQNTWEIRCAIMAISTVKILEARSAHGSRILQSHHTHS